MPNYHASDFPLEGWRQGLNSAPPQSLQRHLLLESLAVTRPPPHTPLKTQTDKACRVSTNPGLFNTPTLRLGWRVWKTLLCTELEL